MTHEQKVRARVAARELRLGVSWNFAPIVLAVQQLHRALLQRDPAFPLDSDAALAFQQFLEQRLEDVERALETGRLLVIEGAFPLLAIQPEPELTSREVLPLMAPPLPSIARRRPDEKLTFFEVRFVDEIGQAISGLEVELSAGALVEAATTNPAGVAEVTDATSMEGAVQVVSISALDEILDPRWQSRRPGREPSGKNTKSFALTGARIAGVQLKPAVPNTVVITPPVGKLFVELWDKTGRVRHTETEYSISGPESFSGTTDVEGRLLHEGVFPGDYELKLTLQDQTVACPLLVLDKNAGSPQVRRLGAVPFVLLARMFGMLFETDKNFLLPSALPSLREIRQLYEASNPSELLIVGHTDTAGDPSHNDTLSLERADAVAAYLLDEVEAWLARYEPGVEEQKRWGNREDVLMLTAMPDFPTKPPEEDAVRWFQRTRNLEMDGVAGPKTREQLVKEYMRLDGVTLAKEPDLQINITTHGCGEHFPLDDSGENVDETPSNDTEAPKDRRVELYFFDSEFGIAPPPPGKNSGAGSSQYPEWRKRAQETLDFDTDDVLKATCHFSFVLNDEATGEPRGFSVIRFEVEPGVPVAVQTDQTGLFEFGDVKPGDYELDVDGLLVTVSALPKDETNVPLLLRPDPEFAS